MPGPCDDAQIEMAYTELALPLKACRSRLYGQPAGAAQAGCMARSMAPVA